MFKNKFINTEEKIIFELNQYECLSEPYFQFVIHQNEKIRFVAAQKAIEKMGTQTVNALPKFKIENQKLLLELAKTAFQALLKENGSPGDYILLKRFDIQDRDDKIELFNFALQSEKTDSFALCRIFFLENLAAPGARMLKIDHELIPFLKKFLSSDEWNKLEKTWKGLFRSKEDTSSGFENWGQAQWERYLLSQDALLLYRVNRFLDILSVYLAVAIQRKKNPAGNFNVYAGLFEITHQIDHEIRSIELKSAALRYISRVLVKVGKFPKILGDLPTDLNKDKSSVKKGMVKNKLPRFLSFFLSFWTQDEKVLTWWNDHFYYANQYQLDRLFNLPEKVFSVFFHIQKNQSEFHMRDFILAFQHLFTTEIKKVSSSDTQVKIFSKALFKTILLFEIHKQSPEYDLMRNLDRMGEDDQLIEAALNFHFGFPVNLSQFYERFGNWNSLPEFLFYFSLYRKHGLPENFQVFKEYVKAIYEGRRKSWREDLAGNKHYEELKKTSRLFSADLSWDERQKVIADLKVAREIVETDDPDEIFEAANQVSGSCQSVYLPFDDSQYLIGFLINAHVKMLIGYSSDKQLIYRAVIRLLLNEDLKPVLQVEDPLITRNVSMEEARSEILEAVFVRAIQLNLPIRLHQAYRSLPKFLELQKKYPAVQVFKEDLVNLGSKSPIEYVESHPQQHKQGAKYFLPESNLR